MNTRKKKNVRSLPNSELTRPHWPYLFNVWKYTTIQKHRLIQSCIVYQVKIFNFSLRTSNHVHERFVHNWQGWNMRNIYRARGDKHHYDDTSKYCVHDKRKIILTGTEVLRYKWRLLLLPRTVTQIFKMKHIDLWRLLCNVRTTWSPSQYFGILHLYFPRIPGCIICWNYTHMWFSIKCNPLCMSFLHTFSVGFGRAIWWLVNDLPQILRVWNQLRHQLSELTIVMLERGMFIHIQM